jgi:hypothetical protein
MATTQEQQRLQDIIKLINSGQAKFGNFYTFQEGEGTYGAQDILSDGKVAFKGGYLPVGGEVQVGREPGTNNYSITVPTGDKNSLARLNVTVDPATGTIQPVTSEQQLEIVGTGRSGGGFFDNVISNTLGRASDFIGGDPLRAAALFGGAAYALPSLGGATTAAGTTAGGAAGAGAGGLMTNAALDAQFIAADAAQLAGQGLSSGQIAQTLASSGVDSLVAADVAQLAAQGIPAAQIASTVGATIPTSTAATGAGGLFAGTGAGAAGAAAGGAGVAGGAGLGAAAAGGAGGITAQQLATAGLISGGLNLAGGLLQGQTSQDAYRQLAAQSAALAEKTLQMGKFQPVGVTTRFGTSSFTTDPVTGAITPSYTLSPEAKAYQDSLSGMATQSLAAGQGIMNLGQQYVGESPEAVRNRYIQTQRALLAPQQEQTLAALRNRQAATGRGGLAFGATSDGMLATNPEMAAYYNSLAQTERQLAANAETQYQNQVNFGTGLLNQATTPFTNVFGAQKGVELQAQQPLELATNFANTVATRGAAQGANYATAMNPSLQAQYNANNYNPWASALQGAGSNPLTGYGLMNLTGLTP